VVTIFPSLAWHLFAHWQGAVFYDYAPLWRPSPARFLEALHCILRASFFRPWRFGFAYPVAMLLILAGILGRRLHVPWRVGREALVVAGMALVCIPAFALVYSYSGAPDFEWHVRTSLDRLLWCPAMMVVVLTFRTRPLGRLAPRVHPHLMRRVKRHPLPGSLSTCASPPWRVAMCFTIARPRPVPPCSRLCDLSTR